MTRLEEKHSLKKQVEECEKAMMGPKKFGEKIINDFKNEINQIYSEY